MNNKWIAEITRKSFWSIWSVPVYWFKNTFLMLLGMMLYVGMTNLYASDAEAIDPIFLTIKVGQTILISCVVCGLIFSLVEVFLEWFWEWIDNIMIKNKARKDARHAEKYLSLGHHPGL
jgi:hypothetical protein